MSDCCQYKNVGGVDYELFTEVETVSNVFNCKNNCIYEIIGEPGRAFCFAAGYLQSICEDKPTPFKTTANRKTTLPMNVATSSTQYSTQQNKISTLKQNIDLGSTPYKLDITLSTIVYDYSTDDHETTRKSTVDIFSTAELEDKTTWQTKNLTISKLSTFPHQTTKHGTTNIFSTVNSTIFYTTKPKSSEFVVTVRGYFNNNVPNNEKIYRKDWPIN